MALLNWKLATTIGATLGVMSHGAAYEDETDLLTAVGYASTLVYIWNRTRVLGAIGPYGLAYMGGAAVGTAISGLVFGEQGIEDAASFYTGSANYFSGDPNESGYFNIQKNVETILVEQLIPRGRTEIPRGYRPGFGGRLA